MYEIPEHMPLVSVVVVAYNSSKFIIETLESVRAQTYKNIELIITDDHSTDNTVSLSEEWIASNASCFHRALLVCAEKNSGIAQNCNRGFHEVQGEWVKFIAGDDLLECNCIEEFMAAANEEQGSQFFTAGIVPFGETTDSSVSYPYRKYNELTARQQNRMLYGGLDIPGPSLFIKKSLLKQVGGFNERFPFIEDYPLLLKITDDGVRIRVLYKPLVKYRVHAESITVKNASPVFRCYLDFMEQYFFPTAKKNNVSLYCHYLLVKASGIYSDKNHAKKILMLLSPVFWMYLVYRIAGKQYAPFFVVKNFFVDKKRLP